MRARSVSLLRSVSWPFTPVTLSKEFKQEIKAATKGKSELDIVNYCNDKTQSLLTFSTKCELFDDRKVTKWKNITNDHDCAEVRLSNQKIIYVDPSLNIIQQ